MGPDDTGLPESVVPRARAPPDNDEQRAPPRPSGPSGQPVVARGRVQAAAKCAAQNSPGLSPEPFARPAGGEDSTALWKVKGCLREPSQVTDALSLERRTRCPAVTFPVGWCGDRYGYRYFMCNGIINYRRIGDRFAMQTQLQRLHINNG